jgi:hypothetical protein
VSYAFAGISIVGALFSVAAIFKSRWNLMLAGVIFALVGRCDPSHPAGLLDVLIGTPIAAGVFVGWVTVELGTANETHAAEPSPPEVE